MPRHPHPPVAADPGPLHWVDPRQANPDHPAMRDWQAQIAAGRIATAPADPAPDPELAAIQAANAALFARRRRERCA